jgi:hypothetical protein
MATGVRNEQEYVRFFSKFYGDKKRLEKAPLIAGKKPLTVIFKEKTSKDSIVLSKATSILRVGQRGDKTDLVVYYDTNKRLKISIKDNTSIYWGSDDVYIRKNLGERVRNTLKELATKDKRIVEYDKSTKKFVLKTPIAFTPSIKDQNHSLFGVTDLNLRNNPNDTKYCDIIIRGEINEKDVIIDYDKNSITFLVKTIYKSLSDVPKNEIPLLFVYPAKRKTFDDQELNIEGFSGIRGSFRSFDHVKYRVNNKIY